MLKSDVRTFSYENLRVEGAASDLSAPILKKQAISFQFSLSIPTNSIIKLFLDLASAKYKTPLKS